MLNQSSTTTLSSSPSSPRTEHSSPIKALIFDFDGLILDTETAIFEAWRSIYVEHGHDLTLETWAQCVGSDFGHYNPATELEQLIGHALDWSAPTERRRAQVFKNLEGSQPMPGVQTLLEAAQQQNIPCGVASSSSREWVGGWLEKLNLRPFFKTVVTLEDTGRVKPDPSLFLRCAEQLGIEPEYTVVLEDSLNGLRAATAAGMRCVIVPCAVTKHLQFTDAWKQLITLENFLPWTSSTLSPALFTAPNSSS